MLTLKSNFLHFMLLRNIKVKDPTGIRFLSDTDPVFLGGRIRSIPDPYLCQNVFQSIDNLHIILWYLVLTERTDSAGVCGLDRAGRGGGDPQPAQQLHHLPSCRLARQYVGIPQCGSHTIFAHQAREIDIYLFYRKKQRSKDILYFPVLRAG